MHFRIGSVAALFIIAFYPLGTSQDIHDIPDDVVYTEVKKTLVFGSKGVLTCRFKGVPNAVYWKKGSDPEKAPFVMSWSYDQKVGPRYEDGSCDIDENYSLIIKNVTYEDEGRYICRVSTYKGVLKHNFTDVTITTIAVKTEPNVALQMGKVGVLPCKVLIHPRHVSWVKGRNSTLVTMKLGVIDIGGTGHEGSLFNITKDYSLVINDVTIQHEDNYFCEVTDIDTGRMYRDLTALAVYAQPTAPFPAIEGCPIEDHTNCIITTDSSITLTCYTNEYYPDINLFFMHGSKRVESIDTKTWNNTDGTKNTSTMIYADKINDAYKCIASGIPGLGINDEVSASVRLIQEQRNSLILTVLFVPIVICLTGVLLTWMRLRKRGKRLSKEERYMEDHISFAELWQLAEYIKGNDEKSKSLDGNEELPKNMDQDYYFQELCRWKGACAQTANQRITLYDKCSKAGEDKPIKQLEGFRKHISSEVPLYDLEHILWQITGPQEIADFLENLGVKIPHEMLMLGEKKIIQEAVGLLESWTKGNLPFNPVVILSSTLEQMGMCTSSNNFFQVPDEEKEEILEKDVQRLMRDLTKSHCQKLKEIIEASGAKVEIMPTGIATENAKVLFDTGKMLCYWWQDVACSNYEKRRKLENACQEVSKEIKSTANSPWLSDEELKIISRYLDSPSMTSVCEKLRITSLQEDADEKGRFKTFCVWRASVSESDWMAAYGSLRNALGGVGILGLLAPLKDKPIHKAEYVEIAFELLMTDVVPLARALGIKENKLPTYRPIFEPTHLKKGSIGLVAHLVESTTKDNERLELCSRLSEAGFPPAIVRNILVYRMAYGELYAISEEMRKCDCKQRENDIKHDEDKSPGEGDSLLRKDNTSTEIETPVEKAQGEGTIAKRHSNEIKKMLRLSDMTEEDRAECQIPKEYHDEFAWFRIWKERPHLAVFNERAAIILELFDMHRDVIARAVTEGTFYNTEVSLQFVRYIVKKMDKDKMLQLAEAFSLKKEFEGFKDSDDLASRIINRCFEKNKSGVMHVRKAKEYKDSIDKLAEKGFLDIARELIIIQK